MFLYLILLVVLCLWGLKFSGFREEYISKDQTDSLKGIFVIMIVFSHLRSFMPLISTWDRMYSAVFTLLGQMPVVLFFFYSGYGIMESVKRKPGYIDGFFKKRILKLLLDYNIVMVLYAIYHTCTGTFFSAERYLLSWCGWESLETVNTEGNWFLFVILQLYLITFIAFQLFKKNMVKDNNNFLWLVLCFTTVMSVVLMGLLYASGRDEYWYNTLFVYSFGMLYSILRDPIERAMRKTGCYILALGVVCAGVALILFLGLKDVASYSVMGCLFASFAVLVSMHVRIQNSVLIWFGKLSFSVYILQKVSMRLFNTVGLSTQPILYTAACLVFTMVLAQLHNMAANKLSGLLLKAGKQQV